MAPSFQDRGLKRAPMLLRGGRSATVSVASLEHQSLARWGSLTGFNERPRKPIRNFGLLYFATNVRVSPRGKL
jgi:hypothetical protein